jgi:hypothetical protein
MKAFVRIILWLALAFACFLPASALTLTAPENRVWEIFNIGYDAPVTETTDLGSHTKTSTSNYDTAPIHGAIADKIPTETNRVLFGQNAEFKAAEDAGVLRQLGGSGVRNTEPLTAEQIEQVYQSVDALGLDRSDVLISSGPSLYSDMMDKILIGPDAFPGAVSDGSALSQLSPASVIAHEAGHMITTRAGTAFEGGSIEDEVQATMVGRGLPGLSQAEQDLLLQHAQETAAGGVH